MDFDDQNLLLFSNCLIAVIGVLILVPYLLRKCDLVTARNAFLGGSAVFIGISGIKAATSETHIIPLRSSSYSHYMFGNVLFLIVLLAAYHYLKFPRSIGRRMYRTWPQPSMAAVLYSLAVCAAIFLLARALPVPVLSQLCRVLSGSTLAFATALAFASWYKNNGNLFRLLLLLATVAVCMVMAVLLGGGRKAITGVVLTVPVILYWFYFRKKNPVFIVGIASVVGSVLFLLLASYSMTRWFDAGTRGKERNLQTSVEQLANTVINIGKIDALQKLIDMGQLVGDVSLYCIEYSEGDDPHPFYTLKFMIASPIPRQFWQDKPRAVGDVVAKRRYYWTRSNWGATTVGHAFYEGGPTFAYGYLVLYAVLFAVVLRAIDEMVLHNHTDPFVISLFSALVIYLIAWPRGDIGTIGINVVGVFILGMLIRTSSLFLFGGAPRFAPTYQNYYHTS